MVVLFLVAPAPPKRPRHGPGAQMCGKHLLVTIFHFPGGSDPLASLFNAETMEFLCYQHEKAGTTARDHLQVFVVFKKRLTLHQVQLALGDPTCHIEPRHGTVAQAVAYCTKEDTRADGPWRHGVEPASTGQGTRTDLIEAMGAIKNGMSEMEFSEKYPSLAFHAQSGIQRMFKIFAPMRSLDVRPVVELFCGATGAGKTYDAIHSLRDEYHCDPYVKPPSSIWFDQYRAQKGVVFDEFTAATFQFHLFLTLLDWTPTSVQFKGGSAPFMAEHIIITSNKPGTWYSKTSPLELDAMWRRLHRVVIYRARDDKVEFINPGVGHEREFRDLVLAKWKEFGVCAEDQGALATPGCPE